MSAHDKLTDFIIDLLHEAGVTNSLMSHEQAAPVFRKVDGLIDAFRAEVLREAADFLLHDGRWIPGSRRTAEGCAGLLRLMADGLIPPSASPSPAAGDKQPETEVEQPRARDELYLFAMVGKVQEDGNRQMAVRKLDAYRDELLADAKRSAALAEEDYQRVVRAASQMEETLRARIAELEAVTPAAIQTCRKCGSGYTYGEPCSTCQFKSLMADSTKEAE
ncbi:hypothetical protein [Streptomyces sp. NPDC059828]|uniref:hypothetical protein n=1 Tax=Streptomyces sp. NPDC059828 TaxID=3346965 RepID=UPI00365BD1C0